MSLPATKLSKLKERWAAGDKPGALRIASKFPSLGDEKEAIELGWACYSSPAWYKQLGIDTEAAIAAAYAALASKYDLPLV